MDSVERKRKGNVRGTIDLEVQVEFFMDSGGNDRLRVQAYFEGKSGSVGIGGVDIMPNPPSPLLSIIQHATGFEKKGTQLIVTSALIGAAGPIVGECISNNDDDRFAIRQNIKAKIDSITEAAFENALKHVTKIHESE